MNKYRFILFIILLFPLPGSSEPVEFKMLEANLISGLIPDIEDGYGVAFRDFNSDGYPDIYMVCFRNLNRLLINNGGIVPFIDRTIYSGLGGDLMPRGQTNLELGACAADYDNDGNTDLFLAGWGKTHKLFRSLGKLKFEDATENLNMQGVVDANQALWIDANNDGYLDLYITDEHHVNRFLINQKNGFFDEALWTESFIDSAVSQGACVSDFDLDGDADIYVANWFEVDYLLINDGSGLFSRAVPDLPTLTSGHSSNSATAADIDNDGDPDLMIAGRDGSVYWYENQSVDGQLVFTEKTGYPFRRLSDDDQPESVYGILLEDFNHDGWLDCFLSVKGRNRLYLNDGRGGFDDRYDSDGRNIYSTGSAAADFDDDGDLDILVSSKNALSQVYLNPTNNKRFLKIRLTGVRSNREALGAKIYFYSTQDSGRQIIGSRTVKLQSGYLSSTDPMVHFGTGNHQSIDAEIVFPSGKKLLKRDLRPGNFYSVSEYNMLISQVYFFMNTIRYQASRSDFWINLFLIFFFMVLIYVYMQAGIRRYHWQAALMAGQLIIWFIVSLVIFILFRNQLMKYILLAINGFSIFVILIVLAYSEFQRHQSLRRARFRKALQKFSDRIISIHENDTLYNSLLSTVEQHEDITRADLFLYQEKKLLHKNPKKPGSSPGILPQVFENTQLKQLIAEKIIYKSAAKKFPWLFENHPLNIFLPVTRGNELFGLIGLQMADSNTLLNREDLQIILPIANQTAIAIENNNYIEQNAEMVKELTEARLREEYLKQLETTNRQLDLKNAELTRLFKELQEKESQLIHSEKMASLGQLVAGISHELNNPISFIYANSQALSDYVDELENFWKQLNPGAEKSWQQRFDDIVSELRGIISDNINGSRSVKELVLNLKNFSRLDQAEWKEARILSGIESSLNILKPQVSEGVSIEKNFESDPLIFCNPGQLNQVFVNILSNALQAIKNEGTISIRTSEKKDRLEISFTDTGQGISREILPKIFDPFFTTKDVNKGTGLGLSISYSIIQKHGGEMLVESEQGQGTTFIIRLPLKKQRKRIIPNG